MPIEKKNEMKNDFIESSNNLFFLSKIENILCTFTLYGKVFFFFSPLKNTVI